MIRRSDGQFWTGSGWSALSTWVLPTGTTSWSYAWTPLPSSGAYTYTITARATDNASLAANSASVSGITVDTSAPAVVSAASVDPTHVDVVFSETVTGANPSGTGFTIAGLGVSAATVSGSAVHLTTSTQSNAAYTASVAAGAVTDASSNPNTAGTANFTGQAPASLSAPVVSASTSLGYQTTPAGWAVTLSWPTVSGATAYELHDAGSDALLGTTSSTSIARTGLAAGTHGFYVVATAGAIRSAHSSSVSVTFGAVAPASQRPAPANMRLLSASYFDLSASRYSGSINVALSYDPADVTGDPSQLRLLHYSGGSWHDITTSVDTANHIVHGTTGSFSDFTIGEPTGPTPPTPVTSTPASSDWSVGLLAIAGMGLAGWAIKRQQSL